MSDQSNPLFQIVDCVTIYFVLQINVNDILVESPQECDPRKVPDSSASPGPGYRPPLSVRARETSKTHKARRPAWGQMERSKPALLDSESTK